MGGLRVMGGELRASGEEVEGLGWCALALDSLFHHLYYRTIMSSRRAFSLLVSVPAIFIAKAEGSTKPTSLARGRRPLAD